MRTVGLHHCPNCNDELATGTDLYGKPAMCGNCRAAHFMSYREQRAKSVEESKDTLITLSLILAGFTVLFCVGYTVLGLVGR